MMKSRITKRLKSRRSRKKKRKLQKLKIKTQYLMVKVKNPGALPKEHAAAGSPSFIFMDEIIVQ